MEARWLESTDSAVVLETSNGKRLTVPLGQLSADDQAFLKQMAQGALEELLKPEPEASAEEKTIADYPAEPGKVSAAIPCKAAPEWSYFVYLPKSFNKTRLYPIIYVMDPGGGKAGTVNRYVPAAERHGFIVAASKESKNGFVRANEAIDAMMKDTEARLPVLSELTFASGMSGGSRLAYLLAERNPSISGVIACGSGHGVYPDNADLKVFHDAKLRPGLPVYSLEGTNCFNRDEAVRSHNTFSNERCRLTFFPGKHDWAKPELIADGLSFVFGIVLKDLSTPKTAEKSASKSRLPAATALAPKIAPALRDQQLRYSRAVWKRTQENGIPSLEKADWMQSLADFPGEPLIRAAAAKSAAELSKDPEVQAGREANHAIATFAKKHYSVYDKDKNPKPAREAEAEKIAEKFDKLPQAEILRKLAKPAA
jgi:dienelactone hydrolase